MALTATSDSGPVTQESRASPVINLEHWGKVVALPGQISNFLRENRRLYEDEAQREIEIAKRSPSLYQRISVREKGLMSKRVGFVEHLPKNRFRSLVDRVLDQSSIPKPESTNPYPVMESQARDAIRTLVAIGNSLLVGRDPQPYFHHELSKILRTYDPDTMEPTDNDELLRRLHENSLDIYHPYAQRSGEHVGALEDNLRLFNQTLNEFAENSRLRYIPTTSARQDTAEVVNRGLVAIRNATSEGDAPKLLAALGKTHRGLSGASDALQGVRKTYAEAFDDARGNFVEDVVKVALSIQGFVEDQQGGWSRFTA